jgi:uncharacterized membrane protein YdjX (TVP38/TMEM64 family)
LLEAKGLEAFFLVLSLRLLPFVPSGVVTFVATIGKTPLLIFIIASSIGKIPALLLEAYSHLQEGTVDVDYDETKVSVEKLKEAIEEQGYDVK